MTLGRVSLTQGSKPTSKRSRGRRFRKKGLNAECKQQPIRCVGKIRGGYDKRATRLENSPRFANERIRVEHMFYHLGGNDIVERLRCERPCLVEIADDTPQPPRREARRDGCGEIHAHASGEAGFRPHNRLKKFPGATPYVEHAAGGVDEFDDTPTTVQ